MVRRILLKKGVQRDIINSVKEKTGLSWVNLAESIGYNPVYLSFELRNEKRTLREDIYKKFCDILSKNFDDFVISRPTENWGQIKGGKNVIFRKNLFSLKKPKILCAKSEKLAEIIGILMGDGSVYILPEKSIYQISVASNPKDNYERLYLLSYVKPLFEETFKLKMSFKKTSNGNYIYKQSKDLVYTLKRMGMVPGNKKLNNIMIPKWISKNVDLSRVWLRGIVDTDGYVYPKNKAHRYPTISISSAIPGLQESITDVCVMLGLNLSHWRKKGDRSAKDAYLRTREDNFKFVKEIGFKNPKHRKRWEKFTMPC